MLAVSILIKRSWLPHARAWCREAAKIWQHRLRRLFDPYRPEFHYMRGPGPRWREKHGEMPARQIKAPNRTNE
jgi:hypothetical protein